MSRAGSATEPGAVRPDPGAGSVAASGRLLFLCPDHFELYRIFEQGFERYSGCAVTRVLYRPHRLRGPLQRLANSLAKRLLRIDLRTWLGSRRGRAAVRGAVRAGGRFDYAVVICPERWRPADLAAILGQARTSVVYYWDGFDHFPAYHETVGLFDRRCTFDPVDAERYGLVLVPNFYWFEDRDPAAEYDLFFIGAGVGRFAPLLDIATRLEARGLRLAIYLLADDPALRRMNRSRSIHFIDRFIPPAATRALIRRSRVLLDLHKDIQRGLSFRAFEAMGAGKKLITTNPDIVNYDFYDPENIFVLDGAGTLPPDAFFRSPYRELPTPLYRRYSQQTWVETVLGIGGATPVYRRPPGQ